MSDPTAVYYAWYPSQESGGKAVSILLTGGWRTTQPVGNREFFVAVLSSAGVDADLMAWGIEPFMTCYFSGAEWQECWNARLLATGAIKLPDRPVKRAPVNADPGLAEKPTDSLPVRVLADFTRRTEATRCRAALRKRANEARWNEIHYERYLVREVGRQHVQLLVDVVTVERARFTDVVPAAEEVMEICTSHGGRLHPE
jgi:hypothetical protein